MSYFSLLMFLLLSIDKIKCECPPTMKSIEHFINDGHIPGIAIIVTDPKEILY